MKAPTTYQEWLDCFAMMKSQNIAENEVYEIVKCGSFSGTDVTVVALQNQIIDTVNVVLDKSAKRFIKKMNDCISFNDLSQLDMFFLRLKGDINRVLFFESLLFLPKSFRTELSESVKKQMAQFWSETVDFLYEQSLEFKNSDLEDVLFLIKRIHLF